MDYSMSVHCSGNVCLASHWLAMDFHSGSTIRAFRCHVTLLPPSSRISYWCTTVPSSPRFLLVTRFFLHDYLPTSPTAPSLRALVPRSSLIRFQSIQVYHHHPKFSFSNGGSKTIPSSLCFHISGSFYAKAMSRFYFRFGGG
jgi:hypothetical protein